MCKKIAIIDTGVDCNNKFLYGKKINGFSLIIRGDNVEKLDDFMDENGHGTALFYLMNNLFDDEYEITNIKVICKSERITCGELAKFINYVVNFYSFDYINISMGTTSYSEGVVELEHACNNALKKGICIVSAFSNDGWISYPAAFSSVIGIDGTLGIGKPTEFVETHEHMVNVLGHTCNYTVAWVNMDKNIVSGNSFLCPYLIRAIENGEIKKNLTESNAFGNHCALPAELGRVIAFPVNKEILSLAMHRALINCVSIDFSSVKYLRNVGYRIKDIYPHIDDESLVKDIEEVDFSAYDTIVLGHLNELEKLCHINIREKIIEKSKKNNVYIYSFDEINDKEYENLYYPRIVKKNIVHFGKKLFKVDKPVLSIVGTSSSQGKFTFQLILRRLFLEAGYKVGQLGTEPSSLLFGMDEVYHNGYETYNHLSEEEIVIYTNLLLGRINSKNPDIIITGSQSGLIPVKKSIVSGYPIRHQIYFETIIPDGIIVCINPFDTIQIIRSVILTAEGLSGGKVIGVVCYPMDSSPNWRGGFGKREKISVEKEVILRKKIYNEFGIGLYVLGNDQDMQLVFHNIISFFSEK